jgi:hypothetical protein
VEICVSRLAVTGVDHDISVREVWLQLGAVVAQKVCDLDAFDVSAGAIFLAHVQKPEVVTLSEGWQQLVGYVSGGTGQKNAHALYAPISRLLPKGQVTIPFSPGAIQDLLHGTRSYLRSQRSLRSSQGSLRYDRYRTGLLVLGGALNVVVAAEQALDDPEGPIRLYEP